MEKEKHSKKTIVFSGFPIEYFHGLGKFLEKEFNIIWIFYLKSELKKFKKLHSSHYAYLLSSKENFDVFNRQEIINSFEDFAEVSLNDIILMDRYLPKLKPKTSRKYVEQVLVDTYKLLEDLRPEILLTWRDTAPQIISLYTAQLLGINSFIPTRIRIPNNFFGLTSSIYTNSFLKIGDIQEVDITRAEEFIKNYNQNLLKPELKIATRSFIDVIQLLPNHAKAFFKTLEKVIPDTGNQTNRYSIWTIVRKYFSRRLNLFSFKLMKPYHRIDKDQFINTEYCFYPLHTQPESSIDVQASQYSNQIEFLKRISRNLPSKYKLIVKIHPTDVDGKGIRFYRKIMSIPSVQLVNYTFPSDILISKAEIVFTLTGTAGYEAALRYKKVITFSNNFYNDLPNVYTYDEKTPLKELITQVINKAPIKNSSELVKKIAEIFASTLEGYPSKVYGAMNEPLTNSDYEAYLRLIQSVK